MMVGRRILIYQTAPSAFPNPDELRAQALHALASRITSLYWFNLSKSSLEKFPDTWEPMRRLGREIRMLEDFYLEGDAYRFEKLTKKTGEPDWELSSILSPRGMLLFALDTDYKIDPKTRICFQCSRDAKFSFAIPHSMRENVAVKALTQMAYTRSTGGLTMVDLRSLTSLLPIASISFLAIPQSLIW